MLPGPMRYFKKPLGKACFCINFLVNFEKPFCVYMVPSFKLPLAKWIMGILFAKFIKYKHILSNIAGELYLMVPLSLPPESLVYETFFLCL